MMNEFQNILVYTDTQHPKLAIDHATKLCANSTTRLTLIDVVKPVPKALGLITDVAKPEEIEQLVATERRSKLHSIAQQITTQSNPVDAIVTIGDPATEVSRRVIEHQHDLLVKAADSSAGTDRLFGSVEKSLLRVCPCPVWLLKPEMHGQFDQVLAAIDVESEDKAHTSLNRSILEHAFSIARNAKAELHIVAAWQVWMEDSMRRHAGDDAIDCLQHDYDARVHHELDELLQAPYAHADDVHVYVRKGSPASVIRSIADDIEVDLVVMGTVCRTGVSGFLIGNTAETLIADLTCSLLALKPAGFLSPLELVPTSKATEDQPLPII